jgi:hypothetical protein
MVKREPRRLTPESLRSIIKLTSGEAIKGVRALLTPYGERYCERKSSLEG